MTDVPVALTRRFEEMERDAAGQMPAAALSAFDAERAALDDAGVPSSVLPVGSPLPEGELLDAAGASTTIRETADGAPAVLVFYRGAWCPYCSLTLRTYQEEVTDELARRGVTLIAISPQKPDGSLTMREKHELDFPVLSDPGNRLARGLGILSEPNAEVLEQQGKLGLDLTEVNADGTPGLPMPTVALLDGGAVLRWIDVHPNYARRTEPAELLAAVAEHL